MNCTTISWNHTIYVLVVLVFSKFEINSFEHHFFILLDENKKANTKMQITQFFWCENSIPFATIQESTGISNESSTFMWTSVECHEATENQVVFFPCELLDKKIMKVNAPFVSVQSNDSTSFAVRCFIHYYCMYCCSLSVWQSFYLTHNTLSV